VEQQTQLISGVHSFSTTEGPRQGGDAMGGDAMDHRWYLQCMQWIEKQQADAKLLFAHFFAGSGRACQGHVCV
jgi:hypothetical protein